MSESVITPIFLGVAVNGVVFFISLYVFKKKTLSKLHI